MNEDEPLFIVAHVLRQNRPVADEYAGGDGNLAFIAHTAQWTADRNAIAEYLDKGIPGFDPKPFIAITNEPNREETL